MNFTQLRDSHIALSIFAVLLCHLVGCSRSTPPSGTSSVPPEYTSNYRPELSSDADSSEQARLIADEREKLHQQQLELEREKAKFELARKEQELEAERRKLEAERESMAAELQARQAAENAKTFSDVELEVFRQTLSDATSEMGSSMLAGTHPTGTYSYTDSPLVTLSGDRETLSSQCTVHWNGGFSETPYTTTYCLTLIKKGEGEYDVGQLSVVRDTAIIKIDPQFLKATENALREGLSR